MDNKKPKTILLVEDDAMIAVVETIKLKKYGYNVIHVLNGQKAIETANDNSNIIDLILMDINLGEKLDGTEIAKLILSDQDIPLIFLSSHTEREVVEKTENITFYGYVVKDSSITVLDASIKMAFRLHEAYQNLKNQKIEIELDEKKLEIFEKRYRRLFESAKDGILILNADNGMIVDVNPYLIAMLDYTKEEFLNKHIWDISAFKNIDYSKQLYKALQDKDYVRYDNLPLETKDGQKIQVEFISNVYLVDTERVIQCNIRDITTRIKHEKSLNMVINKKRDLIKEIQHRTKNSFNMITNLIQLRASVSKSTETKNILEELTLRVQSISDLYSLLHETNSYYEVQLKTYCNKVIESMLSFTKSISINKDIDEITVSTKNAATIGMILVELLSNSIKYAFPESENGIINVELKRVGSNVLLKVEDNGIGLPDDFDITKIESLGLHIVNLMVTQLGGKIKFIPGKGTKVVLELPLLEN
ncbi:MAG: PAS domain S-box protein [Ignavibacteriales bacterium]|nr:PAS domain S-box protein [Ignavibacteriales bacterium]MBP9119391.1 PAS domain S-box protein [Ignavibacterium sp.]